MGAIKLAASIMRLPTGLRKGSEPVGARERAGHERLCRYVLRSLFSQERLSVREDGCVVYEPRRAWPRPGGVTTPAGAQAPRVSASSGGADADPDDAFEVDRVPDDDEAPPWGGPMHRPRCSSW
jgi:hypothetical protein